MPTDLPSINLAKDKEISSFDKFIDWTLMIGHLIVIITEVVAIGAFIYRFSLDEKLVNLHSEIRKRQATISSMKNDENKFRNLQDRITLASSFSEKGIKTSENIINFAKLIPEQVKINNLSLNKDQANTDVDVASVLLLSDFISSLKNSNVIKSISIDNIENNPSVGLSVAVTTTLK
jgi:hypothetical protein